MPERPQKGTSKVSVVGTPLPPLPALTHERSHTTWRVLCHSVCRHWHRSVLGRHSHNVCYACECGRSTNEAASHGLSAGSEATCAPVVRLSLITTISWCSCAKKCFFCAVTRTAGWPCCRVPVHPVPFLNLKSPLDLSFPWGVYHLHKHPWAGSLWFKNSRSVRFGLKFRTAV